MKPLLITLLSCCSLCVAAQEAAEKPVNGERPFTTGEMQRWAQVCSWFEKMMPATFKDYTVKHDGCAEFAWAEINKDGRFLTLVTEKNIPYGNHPNFNITYSRNEDSVSMDEQRIMLGLNEAMNNKGIYDQYKYNLITDKVDKLNEGKVLGVTIMMNARVEFEKKYHIGTTPEKIDLPIAGAYGLMYTYGSGKTLHAKGAPVKQGMEGMDYYMNKAMILISSSPLRVEKYQDDPETGFTEDRYYFTDHASDLTLAPVKNILVFIHGGEEDMRELIKQIDWKGLAGLVGK